MKIDKIDEMAKSINLLRVLLTAIAGLFYVLGYVARFTFGFLGLVLRWILAAVVVGWNSRKENEK